MDMKIVTIDLYLLQSKLAECTGSCAFTESLKISEIHRSRINSMFFFKASYNLEDDCKNPLKDPKSFKHAGACPVIDTLRSWEINCLNVKMMTIVTEAFDQADTKTAKFKAIRSKMVSELFKNRKQMVRHNRNFKWKFMLGMIFSFFIL